MNPVWNLWRNSDMRTALRDGLIGFAPLPFVLVAGAGSGLLYLILTFPAWFIGSCVLPYDVLVLPYNDPGSCWFPPVLPAWQWVLFPLALLLAGAWHAWIYRISVRLGWCVRVAGVNLNPADAYAALVGALLARAWAVWLTDTGITMWENMVFLVAVTLGPAIWRLQLTLWTLLLSLRQNAVATAAAARLFLRSEFRLISPRLIQVECQGPELVVTGPFDITDTARVQDIVAINLGSSVKHVRVCTTLDAQAYNRPRQSVLGTLRESKPIPSAEELSRRYLLGAAGWVGGMVLIAFLLRGQSVPTTSDDFKVIAAKALGARGASDLEFYEALPPFIISLQASKDSCPSLLREPKARWRNVNERIIPVKRDEKLAKPPVFRIHQLNDGFYVYQVDRALNICEVETVWPTFKAAVAATGEKEGWGRIPARFAWRRVPPALPQEKASDDKEQRPNLDEQYLQGN